MTAAALRADLAAEIRDADAAASDDAFASRDAGPDESAAAAWPPGPGLLPTLAAEIVDESKRPWVPLRIGPGAGDEIESLPVGAVGFILGAPGSGKSSLAVEMAIHHAQEVGPVLFISREMKRTHTAARFASNRAGLVWGDVLRGRSNVEAMVDALASLPDVAIIDRKAANLAHADLWILGWRSRGDTRPILVIADYVQILDGHDDAREERARVGQIVEELREWSDERSVVTVALSQMSRSAAKALLSGETVGAGAAAGGAESAQIERAAFVVMAIGEVSRRDDGYTDATLSIAKSRLGEGDRVVPVQFHGASGRYRVTGPATTGPERMATRDAAKGAAKINAAGLAVVGVLSQSNEPMSRRAVRDATQLARAAVYAAITAQIEAGAVVEVDGSKSGGRAPIWTPDRARAAGVVITSPEVRGDRG